MLRAEHVSKYYRNGRRRTAAVQDVSIAVEPGEFVALIGESGCGKSTLARLLTGILIPDEGAVILDGRQISPAARKKDKRIAAAVQLVLQHGKSALDPRFSVEKSIAEPLEMLTSLSKQEIREKTAGLMRRLGLESELAGRKPRTLSGGQQKRVCLARALATEPQYLVFDEVVSGLDVLVRKQVLELIREIRKQSGAGCVFITHDMDVALFLADRIAVMKDGRIVEDRKYTGDPACFTHPYTRELLEKRDPFAP